jgi:hypothetical protein
MSGTKSFFVPRLREPECSIKSQGVPLNACLSSINKMSMVHNLRTILTVIMWWRKAQMNESFFLADDLMSMHGVLYKKGRNLMKKYKKRWFVLPDNSLLLHYFSAPNGKLLGQIDINNILSVKPLQSNKKHLYGLNLTTATRVFSLYARTIEERDGWCSCLTNRLRLIATNKLATREVQVCSIPSSFVL